MSKADMRFSHGTWVGNLYQKFEAMCHEVDDMVGQEHVKNLENHVQLVGDNVMKFCSNVKELIPSSFGVSGKHETQSVNNVVNNYDLEEGDGEGPVAKSKQFPQQMDAVDTSKSLPSCIQVSDDLHFEDKLENPSFEEPSNASSGLQLKRCDSFLINQDYASHCEEEKESSGISDVSYPDRYFTVQSSGSFIEEKKSPFDASELTCHGSSLITENSDSFTRKKEEFLLSISEFIFPDEDPCEASTSSMLHNQNHEPVDKLSTSVSPSEHSSGSEFLLKEETVQDTVDEYSLGPDFPCKDEMVNDSTHENNQGSEFHPEEDILCDSIHECSLGSQACLKEEMVHDSADKHNPGSEFRMKEGIVHDSFLKSRFDVPVDNVTCTLLASSVTSSDSETSNVRLTSSISSPLLDSSNHGETEIGSAFTSSAASQSSESSSCFLSPKANVGDMDSSLASSSMFTEVPIIPLSDNVGHNLEHMELSVKLDLGGSCVFVNPDSNHTTLSAVERSWLRKKTIRGRLSAREKLEKEYKQLAIWFCDIDAEFDEGSGEKLVPSSHNKHLPAQDAQESEWELL